MIELPAESNVLAGHIVEGGRRIPRLVWIARVLGEVRRPGNGGGAIDGWQQHQIASGIVDLATAQRQSVKVSVEPQTVVEHESQEVLFGCEDALAGDDLRRIARAAHAAAMFASHVTSQ